MTKPRLKYNDVFTLPDFSSWGYAEWGVKKLSLDGEIGIYEGDCLNAVWIRFGRELVPIDKEKARGHLKVVE